MTGDGVFTGGCHCGAVRFEAEGEPYRVGLCHCLDCRRHGGAPFAAFVVFPAGRVRFEGEAATVYASSTHGRRRYCPRCGSMLFGRDAGADEIDLHLGALDEADRFTPTYELWTIRRAAWLPPIPGILRRYERDRPGPQRSEP